MFHCTPFTTRSIFFFSGIEYKAINTTIKVEITKANILIFKSKPPFYIDIHILKNKKVKKDRKCLKFSF